MREFDMERDGGKTSERGFALVTVLWAAGLLTVLAAAFSLSVRTHVRIAANITSSAAAEALADAGVTLAILDLTAADPTHRPRFQPSGACAISGEGRLFIQIEDEAAKVDINSAGVPLLHALLVGLRQPPERALAVAEAIFDYRDRDGIRKPNGAERTEYEAAGLPWGPKNAPFDTVDELGQVLGMTPALLDEMRPHITVHSGLAGIDASLAGRELTALLRRGVEGAAGTFGGFPELDPDHPLPAMFNTPSRRRAFLVRAAATGEDGARFVREADVESDAAGYTVRGWRRGGGIEVPAGALPGC